MHIHGDKELASEEASPNVLQDHTLICVYQQWLLIPVDSYFTTRKFAMTSRAEKGTNNRVVEPPLGLDTLGEGRMQGYIMGGYPVQNGTLQAHSIIQPSTGYAHLNLYSMR